MKYYCTILILFCSMALQAQKTKVIAVKKKSPLASYSEEWNKLVYAKCNTAENVNWMSTKEKDVIYVLNLARTYPKLFATSVLKKYPERSGDEDLADNVYYYQSLLKSMQTMQSLSLLQPDQQCYNSAQCHAYQSGITGYEGHDRKKADCKKKEYFNGECCDYGHDDPLDIVLSLLIDDGVESLGHRTICLGEYQNIGVSIQPHKTWKFNAVLDLHF